MAVSKEQVFLVQGQVVQVVAGVEQVAPEIVQRVVVARNSGAAMSLIQSQSPEFRALGYASLKEYEDTVAKLRATLKGTSTDWPMLMEPGLV